MSKDCLVTTMDEHIKQSCGRLLSWGMTCNGRFVTARISESPRTGSECSLLDVLEDNPDPRYFLSQSQMDAIFPTQLKKQYPSLHTTGTKIRRRLPASLSRRLKRR